MWMVDLVGAGVGRGGGAGTSICFLRRSHVYWVMYKFQLISLTRITLNLVVS